jgi:hypothetical protein
MVSPAVGKVTLVPFPFSDLAQSQLRPEDRGAHDWYRFVLSFPPLQTLEPGVEYINVYITARNIRIKEINAESA